MPVSSPCRNCLCFDCCSGSQETAMWCAQSIRRPTSPVSLSARAATLVAASCLTQPLVRSTSVVENITNQPVGLHWRSLRRLPLVAASSTPTPLADTGQEHKCAQWRISPASLSACTGAHSDVSLRWPLLLLLLHMSGSQVCTVENVTSESVSLHRRSLRRLPPLPASSSSTTPAHSLQKELDVQGHGILVYITIESASLLRRITPVATSSTPAQATFNKAGAAP